MVVQVWNEQDAEEEVLAMVARTGLCTSMGSMMRQVLTYNKTEHSLFLKASALPRHDQVCFAHILFIKHLEICLKCF